MKAIMQSLRSLFMLIIIALAASLAHAENAQDWEERDAILVGRISHVEGLVLRLDPETGEWNETITETPFGVGDELSSETTSNAEMILPNNTWIRIGSHTTIRLIALDQNHTELDLSIGHSRLLNNSATSEIVASTPFGTVSAPPGTVFDLEVMDNAVEIIAIDGSVYFTHDRTQVRHEVRALSSGLFADTTEVTATPGTIDRAWHQWNRDMDDLWAMRLDSRGQSSEFLPPSLHSEAYALDTHGRWEMVAYRGARYRFWRPVHVAAGWTPFSAGAWMVWHGDHTWIPSEPFGYVTHHYGNWLYTSGHWYWAPPVTRPMLARQPLLRIGLGWYPGRVAWIHSGAHVGWVPLAPHEPCYTHHHWGRRSVRRTHHGHAHKQLRRYAYHRHSVVIHRNQLHRSRNYRHNRFKRISSGTIANTFRPAPVPDIRRDDSHRNTHRRNRLKNTDLTRRPEHVITAGNRGTPPFIKKTPSQRRGQNHWKTPKTKSAKSPDSLARDTRFRKGPLKKAKYRARPELNRSSKRSASSHRSQISAAKRIRSAAKALKRPAARQNSKATPEKAFREKGSIHTQGSGRQSWRSPKRLVGKSDGRMRPDPSRGKKQHRLWRPSAKQSRMHGDAKRHRNRPNTSHRWNQRIY